MKSELHAPDAPAYIPLQSNHQLPTDNADSFVEALDSDSAITWAEGLDAEEEEEYEEFLDDSIFEAVESILDIPSNLQIERIDEEIDSSQAAGYIRYEPHFICHIYAF